MSLWLEHHTGRRPETILSHAATIPTAAVRTPVDLEVIIPTFNESARLPLTLSSMIAFLRAQQWSARVVVVDNGSSDDTTTIAGGAGSCDDVEVVTVGCAEAGKGAAVLRGLRTSSARFVGFTDADLSTPLATMLDAVATLTAGAAAAIASRHAPGAVYAKPQPLGRRLGGRLFRCLARPLVPGVRDTQCGFKFFDRRAVETALRQVRTVGFAFDVELLRRIHDHGGRIVEIPVTWTDAPGSTVRTVRDGLAAVAAVGRIARDVGRTTPRALPIKDPQQSWPRPRRPGGTEELSCGTTAQQVTTIAAPGRGLARIAGLRIGILNWRDVTHPLAGGAETYIHEIARRWVAAGAHVTFLTARNRGQPRREIIDGVDIHRAGGRLGVYPRTAMRLLSRGHNFDAVVDCQNGIPFFAPLFITGIPALQVIHHVHQDQFATALSPPLAALGRVLEACGTRWVYRGRRSVAVSASTRERMRTRLGLAGIIDIVPNGAPTPARLGMRTTDPSLVLVTRLVPHKRVDLLLHAVAAARARLPRLRVEIVGGGPLLEPLRGLANELGLPGVVTLHGRLPAAERDAVLGSAWLTASTSEGEGWGCSVIEAAAAGIPCAAVRVPGICDSVLHGRTGWLTDDPTGFATTLISAVAELSDRERAAAIGRECQRWASRFSWDRSAELMAASVVSAMKDREPLGRRHRRRARTDMTTLAWFSHSNPRQAAAALQLTEEVQVVGNRVAAVLRGDDVDAISVLEHIGARDATVRTARRRDILAGPDVTECP